MATYTVNRFGSSANLRKLTFDNYPSAVRALEKWLDIQYGEGNWKKIDNRQWGRLDSRIGQGLYGNIEIRLSKSEAELLATLNAKILDLQNEIHLTKKEIDELYGN